MNKYMRFICKIMLSVLALFLFFSETIQVRAEVVEADLIDIEAESDFTVMFTYEGEQPEVVFISPSGKQYGEGISAETEFLSAHGEGWSTYKIIAAEVGTWRVRCDKKNNESVEYSFVDAVDGLVIQSFGIVKIENEQALLTLDVSMGENEEIRYDYDITVILGEDDSAGKLLASGSAYTGTMSEVTVNLAELSSYSGYRFLLEVRATAGLEMFDSMMSETFDYVNPNTPVVMDDFKTKVDISDSRCELDWNDFNKGWNVEYNLVVVADDDTANPIYTNTTANTNDVFYYPVGAKKIAINLYYKQNGVLSEALTKELDLVNGEILTIVTPEITSNVQLELAYKTSNQTILDVNVNEEYGQYNIKDSGSLFFPLKSGINSVEASFAGSNNITYCVKDEIYLDTTPPLLTLYENLDGMTFKTDRAVVSGSVKNAAQLFVNDVEVAIGENGTFSHEVLLKDGQNNITIVAKSASGVGVSRSMNVTRKSGNVILGKDRNYLPLVISLIVSLVIVIWALVTVRKKDKVKKPMSYKRFAIKFGIGVTILDAVCIAAYVYFYLFNTSVRYVDLVKESIEKAARYLNYQNIAFVSLLILSGLLILNLIAGLIVKFIHKKKLEKMNKEAV